MQSAAARARQDFDWRPKTANIESVKPAETSSGPKVLNSIIWHPSAAANLKDVAQDLIDEAAAGGGQQHPGGTANQIFLRG